MAEINVQALKDDNFLILPAHLKEGPVGIADVASFNQRPPPELEV
jgi:hypothetical protein